MPPLRCPNAPAPASLFVRLSMRRTAQSPILADILLPLRTRAHHTAARRIATTAPTVAPVFKAQWRTRQSSLPISQSSQQRLRLFMTSAPRKATHTLFNPQNDEDGNEMVLEITERAAKVRFVLDYASHGKTSLTNMCYPPQTASLGNYDERLQPLPRAAHPSRIWRLPRFPIPHEAGHPPVATSRTARFRGGRRRI